MSKKRFSLGDILRKINEEQHQAVKDAAGGAEVAPVQEPRHASSIKGPLPLSAQPDGNLPEQPVVGSKSHRLQTQDRLEQSAFYPEKPPRTPFTTENGSAREVPVAVLPPLSDLAPTLPAADSYRNYTQKFTAVSGSDLASTDRAASGLDDDEEEPFDLFKYLAILLRRKWVVFTVVLLVSLISLFRYLHAEKYYIATARLLFRPDTQEMLGGLPVMRFWGDREKTFSTHLELLRSQSVLLQVSQNMQGKPTPGIIGLGLTIKQGETNGEKNDIVELAFRYDNAEVARDVLNELCKTYIDYRRDVNAQEVTRLIYKFEAQIDKLQKELEMKENDLRVFKESNQMVQLSNETNLTLSKLADMELALQQTQLALLESKERLTGLNTQISKQELEVVQSATYRDPFQNKIADLELELNTLSSEYSPEHFKVKMVTQQIENLKLATVDSISREAASKTLVKNPIRQSLIQELINVTINKSALEAKRIAQEQLVERFNGDLFKLPAMEQKYAYLQRETESILQTLRMLKSKYEESKVRRDSEESDLKLLELARTPQAALSSVAPSSVAMGILVGIILGIALALLLEFLDQSLKDPHDVEKVLELPLLGIVPLIEADHALLEQAADLTKNVLEPFRALRANLKHIAQTHHLQTFIVCSAVKGEGKTTLAANLAITFSLDGKKVILIDGDLRRSQMHTLFAIPKQIGLSDYLLGTQTIDEIIKPTHFENMFVVTSGERPHNPAELLGTVRFDLLIEELRSKADIIIFDSPALLPVSDTITMAPKMDGVLFVVRTLWTPAKAAKQALNQLRRIGSRLYGGILNGASTSGSYYPYYYGYYGYKYSYEEDQNTSFSPRKLGLAVENGVKEWLASFRYGIPKVITQLNSAATKIVRRKRFWLLFMVLLTITVTRFILQTRMPLSTVGEVTYMGLQAHPSAAGTGNNGISSPSDENRVQQGGGVAENSGNLAKEPSAQLSPTRGALTNELQDSVRIWLKYRLLLQRDRYLALYNKKSFRFQGGGFEQWVFTTAPLFSGETAISSIELDSIRPVRSGDSYQEMIIMYRVVTSTETLHLQVAMIWENGPDGWKIVREKQL